MYLGSHSRGGRLTTVTFYVLGLIVLVLAFGVAVGVFGWYALALLAAIASLVILAVASLIQPVRGLYLLAFVVPFELIPGVADTGVVRLIGWALFLIWLLYRIHSKTSFARWHISAWMFILFVGWTFVSLLWTDNARGMAWVITLMQLCGLYVLASDLLDTPQKIWNVCLSMALGSLVGGIYLIFFRPQVLQPWAQLNPDVSPNHIPSYFMMGFCMFVLLLMTSRHWSVRLFSCGVIGALAYATMLSGGTGGTIGWAMATATIIFSYSWWRWRSYGVIVGIGIVLVLCILVVVSIPELEAAGLFRAYDYGTNRSTLGGRIYIWSEYLAIWAERPFIGWGAEFSALHNTFLWSLVNWGMIGLLLWGGGWSLHMTQAFRQVIVLPNVSNQLKTNLVSVLLFSVLIGFTVNAMSEEIWSRRHLWLLLAMVQAHWVNIEGRRMHDARSIS